ncbi:LolA-related protein [Thiobacillus sedimenti]|uniref:LolA-related protein n=1 Tax=Thiobacillus sedimenti TaxID=3110231 RepID=A0ABZ1CLF7_9PROT|nr:LolA-related protein [Thiobacillus sp. SCUT-2]WRS39147.1 LolA-related protein [Thiobacillus sp. SCUT-2]
MIRRLFAGLVLASLAATAHAAFTLDQLMGALAQHPGGRAKFVEKRTLAVLDRPLIATGEMTYTPPDRLEKRTLTPKRETLVLDHDQVSIERDKRTLTINLASRPEALAFVDSIRSTLAGNRAALEKNYALQLTGSADKWVLTLSPTAQAIAAILQRITISGSADQIHTIDYLLADGDRSELTIEPLGPR